MHCSSQDRKFCAVIERILGWGTYTAGLTRHKGHKVPLSLSGLIPIYTAQYTMERTMSDTTATSTVANRLSLRKIVVASAATFIGLVMTWVVLTAKSEPQAGPPPERPAPLVDVINVSPRTHQLIVYTQGTIDAKRRVELVAQIAGKINDVSPVFADGGFFRKNDVLLSIEPEDYEFALARAQSALAQAEQRLAEERGRSRQAAREWRELGAKDANELFLRKPQDLGAFPPGRHAYTVTQNRPQEVPQSL